MKKILFLISITLLSTIWTYSQAYEKDGVRYTIMTNYGSPDLPEYFASASAIADNRPTGDLTILHLFIGTHL